MDRSMLIKRYHITYGIAIFSLIIGIISLIILITQFSFGYKKIKQKSDNSITYSPMQTKQRDIELNPQMKKWLSVEENVKKKYYKIIVKGFGSTGQTQNGFGVISPSIRVYYVEQDDFKLQGNILSHRGMLFCGQWQLIPASPQEYIYNVINNVY